MVTIAAAASTAFLSGALAAQAPAPPAKAPICRPAPNADYGLSVTHPVQVGGGPLYGSARQRRFLDALTGPAGQRVRYERSVATISAPDGTLVDAYSVTYDGLEKPVSIVLDWYHFTEHFAPQGFLCGRDPQLNPPPPDPFVADQQLHALAVEVATAPGFRAGPVDLGREPVEGLVVDRFRVQSRRARGGGAAAKAEAPGTIVVAYPQTCGGAATSATAIALVSPQGQSMPAAAFHPDRTTVQALLPGVPIPEGSVAATFAFDALLSGLGVRVSFPPAACAGPAAERTPPIAYLGAELTASPMPARPNDDESGATWVAVQAIVDHRGRIQQARALGGPATLVRAALSAIAQWEAQPARANGAPVATAVVLRVSFAPAVTPQ